MLTRGRRSCKQGRRTITPCACVPPSRALPLGSLIDRGWGWIDGSIQVLYPEIPRTLHADLVNMEKSLDLICRVAKPPAEPMLRAGLEE